MNANLALRAALDAPCAAWTDQAESSDAGVGHLHVLNLLPHGTFATAIISRRGRRAPDSVASATSPGTAARANCYSRGDVGSV